MENIDPLEEKELAIVKTLYDWIRRKQDYMKSKYGHDGRNAAGILFPAMVRYARWRGSEDYFETVCTAIHYWMLEIEPEYSCTEGAVELAIVLDGYSRHLRAQERCGLCWRCESNPCDC